MGIRMDLRNIISFVFVHFMYRQAVIVQNIDCPCSYWNSDYLSGFRLEFRLMCLDSDGRTKETFLALEIVEIETENSD